MSYQLSRLGASHPLLADSPAALQAFREAIDELLLVRGVGYRRLWAYYSNPMRLNGAPAGSEVAGSERPYRQAQEWGLPPRLTGVLSGEEPFNGSPADTARKEVVIENDIGWRIDTGVDFLFGRSIVLDSAAPEESRARVIGELLRQVIASHGGLAFLQRMALIGAVYGSVDVVVKLKVDCLDALKRERPDKRPASREGAATDEKSLGHALASRRDAATDDEALDAPAPRSDAATRLESDGEEAQAPRDGSHALQDLPQPSRDEASCSTSTLGGQSIEPPPEQIAPISQLASLIALELVEPARALPLLSPADVTELRAFAQVYQVPREPGREPASNARAESGTQQGASRASWLKKLLFPTRVAFSADEPTTILEIISPVAWQLYRDERLIDSGPNPLGAIPVVHVQNVARPFEYEGGSDVEPLMPLQDELNTRLSDRATRVALQSMKMYLGVGIEGFGEEPVQPGRMWATDNLEARVEEFGGDASAPSEEAAIREIREALDKTSGVNPVASGAIRNRVGNLTSAAALRLTFQSLLARTERKRSNYGAAIERICELVLQWLGVAGVFATEPQERRVRITWPDPIPSSMTEQLEQARLKQTLGIDEQTVQRELGY